MAIKKTKTGYAASASWIVNGERKRKYKTFATKKEAQQWEREVLLSQDEATASTITFGELVGLFLDRKKESVHSATYDGLVYKTSHFMGDLNKRKLDSIKPIILEKWRNELASTSYSPKYKNEIIHTLKSIFKYGSRMFSINDPSAFLEPVRNDELEEDSDIRTITVEEFNTLYRGLEENTPNDRYFKAMIMAVWSTGMRRGEIKGIQWKDYKDKIFTINKAVTGKTRGDRAKVGTPKTKSSYRRVNVDDICNDEIYRLLNFCNEEYGYNDNWFMFGGPTPLANSVIQARFRSAVDESKITPIRLHDLRHSHATILINGGVPISAVSQRLGHSSINMTLKVYTHVTKDAINALITELPNLYSRQISDKSKETSIKKALN